MTGTAAEAAAQIRESAVRTWIANWGGRMIAFKANARTACASKFGILGTAFAPMMKTAGTGIAAMEASVSIMLAKKLVIVRSLKDALFGNASTRNAKPSLLMLERLAKSKGLAIWMVIALWISGCSLDNLSDAEAKALAICTDYCNACALTSPEKCSDTCFAHFRWFGRPNDGECGQEYLAGTQCQINVGCDNPECGDPVGKLFRCGD